jgi:hypothetical protein
MARRRGGYLEMNVYRPLMIFNVHALDHDHDRRLREFPGSS